MYHCSAVEVLVRVDTMLSAISSIVIPQLLRAHRVTECTASSELVVLGPETWVVAQEPLRVCRLDPFLNTSGSLATVAGYQWSIVALALFDQDVLGLRGPSA